MQGLEFKCIHSYCQQGPAKVNTQPGQKPWPGLMSYDVGWLGIAGDSCYLKVVRGSQEN